MNVTPGETRIARLEGGVLSELMIERDNDVQVAGNIYLGKITRVLPGMQAAFVDIGLEKAAFLYVADIVPDLFDDLGDEDDEDDETETENQDSKSNSKNHNGRNNRRGSSKRYESKRSQNSRDNDKSEVKTSEETKENNEVHSKSNTDSSSTGENIANQEEDQNQDKNTKKNKEPESQKAESAQEVSETTPSKAEDKKSEKETSDASTEKNLSSKENKNSEENEKLSSEEQESSNKNGSSRPKYQRAEKRYNNGARKKRFNNRRRRAPLPKIEDVVKEGQEIVVQIAKEPIRTKGARITSHVSLPGRYLVYMPTVSHVGVSRRIGSYEERKRLKEILYRNKPSSGGFIARTNAIGATEEKLVEDMENLKATWQKIYDKKEKSSPPSLIHADMDIVLRAVRDNFSVDIDRLVLDSEEDYNRVIEFVDKNMPELKSRVELYDKNTPIFDVYGIETEINRALAKKVWLKSGGYIIIDTSEALTAIDVNTGRFVGKQNFDETITTTNLEAVDEITYQLKLRSIGGIIIIDFIDMNRYSHRMKVYHALKDALRKDKVKTTISKISDLGLIEMTRKRTRDSLTQELSETCPHCHGTGFVKTPITVAFEIFREIRRVHEGISSRSLLVTTHPRVAKIFFNEGRERLDLLEKRIGKRIAIETNDTYHLEHFEIKGKDPKSSERAA